MPSGAAVAAPTRAAARRDARSALRRDIQGLRAFAVLAVFADHLVGWPAGGFVGVDVFFVISGFLITGILLREHDRTGRISFTGFYARRVRRILPAATVTVAAAVAAAFLVFPASKAWSVLWDGVASALFVGNWRFAATGTDYFSQGAPSPLQNFWSLAVEEQFYFVWPWLMLVVLLVGTRVARRSSETSRNVAGLIMAGIVAASFGWALVQSASSPTLAYFSTLTRVWELGLGALLAIFGGVFARLPMPGRVVMAWTGMAVMVASLFVITPDLSFPAPWAAVPVLGTMLVIAAGIGREPVGNVVLANPIARYVGDMSYSLYLWHWPVIVFAAALYPRGGLQATLMATAVGFVVSVVSYEAIEKPFNGSPLLRRYPTAQDRGRAWRTWRDASFGRAWRMSTVVVATVAVGLCAAAVAAPPSLQGTSADGVLTGSQTAASSQRHDDPIAAGIAAAVHAAAWPADLTPSTDNAWDEGALETEDDRCDDPLSTTCAYGDPDDPRILVYGDSLGGPLLTTVRKAYGADHYIRAIVQPNCAITDVDVRFRDDASRTACLRQRQAVRDDVARTEPDVVYVIQNYAWAGALVSQAQGEAMQEEWAAGSRSLAADLRARGAGVVVFVSPPPLGPSIPDCAIRGSVPDDCAIVLSAEWNDVLAAEAGMGLPFIDTTDWFCSGGVCPPFNGSTLIRRDYIHPSRQYCEKIADVWKAASDEVLGALTAR